MLQVCILDQTDPVMGHEADSDAMICREEIRYQLTMSSCFTVTLFKGGQLCSNEIQLQAQVWL